MLKSLIQAISSIDPQAIAEVKALLHACPQIFFVGNGGSAAIASHMATDWSKNAKIPARALNDPATLTMAANDYGYQEVFAWQLRQYCTPSSGLVCISSSGRSPNILAAADEGLAQGGTVVTLSGFSPDNPLRTRGHANFYVESRDYNVVELTHMAILAAMI